MDVHEITDKALGEEIARRIAERGGSLMMQGFGSFKTVHVPERTHRNPKTNAPVVVPAHDKITFKASKAR